MAGRRGNPSTSLGMTKETQPHKDWPQRGSSVVTPAEQFREAVRCCKDTCPRGSARDRAAGATLRQRWTSRNERVRITMRDDARQQLSHSLAINAKLLCSGVFVAGRTLEDMLAH